jgi:Flp pilus assembly protein TadD
MLVALTAVLTLPYLSVIETASASELSATNPRAALSQLASAAELNPWTPDPTRLAGTIALENGKFEVAETRFRQTTAREPDGWFAWLGAGLSASALGHRQTARIDYRTAESINPRDLIIKAALARVSSAHPLSAAAALRMIASSADL